MTSTNKKKLADFVCIIVAIIWGSGFVASQFAIDAGYSSSMIMAIRFSIASIVLLPFCARKIKLIKRSDVKHGVLAGIFLFFAFYFQIFGQTKTTVSNSAFLTSTNVVMVPFLVWIIKKKAPQVKTFLLAATMLIGIAFLTLDFKNGISFRVGDGLILICAFFFALHIFYLGQAVAGRDPMLITLIQMVTAAIISIIVLFFDRGSVAKADITAGVLPSLYLGICSTCICYLLQGWAQKYTSQTKTGILLSTEGLFGTLFSIALGFETLNISIVIGGLIIFLSVILMEIPFPKQNLKL